MKKATPKQVSLSCSYGTEGITGLIKYSHDFQSLPSLDDAVHHAPVRSSSLAERAFVFTDSMPF